MKKKLVGFVLLFSLILSLTPIAFAYSVPSDTIVYVTPTGECYHLWNCSHIKNSCSSITIANAEYNGYRACSRCDPDVMVGSYGTSSVYQEPIYKSENFAIYKNEQAVSNNPVTNKLTGSTGNKSSTNSTAKAEQQKQEPAATNKEKTYESQYPWWVFVGLGICADRIINAVTKKEKE